MERDNVLHHAFVLIMALFDEPSKNPLPQPSLDDIRYAAGKSLVSIIPLVGGTASELIGLISSPVAERRDAWFEDLQRRLHDWSKRWKASDLTT
ncbi:MAG: hypothetical protein ACR2JB_28790 [Bryobacteraceae bacterium]